MLKVQMCIQQIAYIFLSTKVMVVRNIFMAHFPQLYN